MKEEYLKPSEISKILGYGMTKTYALIHTNGFPKIKIGRGYLIPRSEFDKWIKLNLRGSVVL
ncbi:MAG: helix-turn-helix domain-containing protein [Anaerostipes sp.]|nr:helix-turn-helix domain-containing protein [Anaerostipes sp.]